MLKRAYFKIAVASLFLFNPIESWNKYLKYIALWTEKVEFNTMDVSIVLMTSST